MHRTHLRSGSVSLRETLPRARFLFSGDAVASSCSSDWRACRAGDAFFAVTTADDDGHEHAAKAIARGAVAVIAERLLPIEAPQVLVRDSRSAFARTCQALAGNPSRELRTVGITGTAGKTVIAMLVAAICEAAGEAAGVMSSIGNSDSIVQQAAMPGVPTAAEYASWLARMKTAGCDSAVLEISSQALAERRTSGIALDAAILANIQNDHLDLHNTPRAYQQLKRRIFKHLKPGGLAIVNADDHRCQSVMDKIETPCLTFGLHAAADITASVLERCISEQTFLLTAGDETAFVRTRMIGDHHISNCLAAACFGLAAGYDLATIVRGLEAVERVPGRLERLECGQSFGVFVDAAQSPDTLARAIQTVRQATSGRTIVVFGPRSSDDPARKATLGRVLERGSHLPVITSDEPGAPGPLETAHQVLDGFQRPAKAHVIPGRAAAIRYALGQARAGDCVLIAGRGERISPADGDAREPYDDVAVARQLLHGQTEQTNGRRFRVVG